MKRYTICGWALILSCIFTACSKDFTDLKPYNSLPVTSALLSESDIANAANGMYASMRSANSYGRSVPLINDLLADNVYLSTNNSGRYLLYNTYTVNIQDTYAAGIWSRCYFTILTANNIIDAETAGSAAVDQYKGEAYAIRALNYWTLVKAFGEPYSVNKEGRGVPISLTYAPTEKLARNTVAEVYTQIVSDLTEAIRLMAANKNSSYATKYFAIALLAKVYLHMGDYPKALEQAKNVIDNGGYSLAAASALASYWNNPNPVTNKQETLFEITNDAVNNSGWDALASMYDQSGYGDALANPELYALYSATDARKGLIKTGTRGGVAALFVNKYSNYTNAANKDNIKILRFADVLLIGAEAAARSSNEPLARTYLNRVAQQRDPSFAGFSSTGAALITDIITERRKELAFEGDRLDDLNRLKLDIVRSYSGYPPTTKLIAGTDGRRILPVPQAEVDANPLIEQNDAYK
jgi:hypothetical protein